MPVSKFYTLDLLLYATELLARRTRASHRLTGFSGAQAQLAMHLEHGAVHAQDLAQRLQISKQAVAQLVDAMVAEGTLARHPDPTDRRAKLIRFTNKGQKQMRNHRRQLADIEARLTELAGDKAMTRLRKSLTRILPHLIEESHP